MIRFEEWREWMIATVKAVAVEGGWRVRGVSRSKSTRSVYVELVHAERGRERVRVSDHRVKAAPNAYVGIRWGHSKWYVLLVLRWLVSSRLATQFRERATFIGGRSVCGVFERKQIPPSAAFVGDAVEGGGRRE